MAKTDVIIIDLVDRRESDFIMEGTEGSDHPIALDCPSHIMVLNKSYVEDTKTGVRRKTRWIAGCNTIFVDEQDKAKIEPNPLTDHIVLVTGNLTVQKSGNTYALYDFLKKHHLNESNPDRDKEQPALFREINTSADAEFRTLNLEADLEALMYISKSRKKKATGGFTYDAGKINWMSKLFNIATEDSDQERFEALVQHAKKDPEAFMIRINDVTSECLVNVKRAIEFSLLSIDGDTASFVGTKAVILKLRSKDTVEKMEELAEYLVTPAADDERITLKGLVSKAMANDPK